MDPIVFIIIFVLGLLIGSFNNVLIHRILLNQSIVKPGSQCPKCQSKLKFYDNIPVLSYLILRGKCRNCKNKISIRYPLVELLTPLLFVLAYAMFGLELYLAFALIFINIGIIIVFIDIDHKIIPDRFIITLLIIGILHIAINYGLDSRFDIGYYIFGGIIGFMSLYIIRIFGELIYKREALGLGDVKLLGVAGLFLGWAHVFLIIILSFVAGAFIELILMRLGIRDKKDEIAFGPYLIMAMLVALFFGTQIISWYLSFLV
jgi:leader peptidase (prepilin peptidase) / N-methyltransferase